MEYRDRTFDQELLSAFMSLKDYSFLQMGMSGKCDSINTLGAIWQLYRHTATTHKWQGFESLGMLSLHNRWCLHSPMQLCVWPSSCMWSHCSIALALGDVVHKGLKKLLVELSKTSKPTEWNKPPKKNVSPLPVKDISFTMPSLERVMLQLQLNAQNTTSIHVHQLITHYSNMH